MLPYVIHIPEVCFTNMCHRVWLILALGRNESRIQSCSLPKNSLQDLKEKITSEDAEASMKGSSIFQTAVFTPGSFTFKVSTVTATTAVPTHFSRIIR